VTFRVLPNNNPQLTTLERRLQWFRQACRQVFGVPDYERYCQHVRDRHPQATVLPPRAFYAMATAKRYGNSRGRCC